MVDALQMHDFAIVETEWHRDHDVVGSSIISDDSKPAHEASRVSTATEVELIDRNVLGVGTANKVVLPCGSRCGRVFDRVCDRRKHEKIHQPQQARPHACPTCTRRFWYPKDLKRHAKLHEQQASVQHPSDGPSSA